MSARAAAAVRALGSAQEALFAAKRLMALGSGRPVESHEEIVKVALAAAQTAAEAANYAAESQEHAWPEVFDLTLAEGDDAEEQPVEEDGDACPRGEARVPGRLDEWCGPESLESACEELAETEEVEKDKAMETWVGCGREAGEESYSKSQWKNC